MRQVQAGEIISFDTLHALHVRGKVWGTGAEERIATTCGSAAR
jgi:hypothetical protein